MRATAALVVGVLSMPVAGEAADFECTVTRKVDSDRLYSADDLSRGKYRALAHCRAKGREFFAMSVQDALKSVERTLGRPPQFVRSADGEFHEP